MDENIDSSRIDTLKAGAKIIYHDVETERHALRSEAYEEGEGDEFINERLARVLRNDSANCHNFMKAICGKELRMHNRSVELTAYLIDYLKHCSQFDDITEGRNTFTTSSSKLEEIQSRMKAKHGDLQPYKEEEVVNFYLTTLKEQQELLDADAFIIDKKEDWGIYKRSVTISVCYIE